MKRYIVLFLTCFLIVWIFSGSVLAASTETTLPQKVEYTLPYPGILADNPLYILKNLRDTIMEWLIADPVKKVEFYILQGDKNLNAGVLLDAKGKAGLAKNAIEEGNTYMQRAVITATSLGAEGRELPLYVIEKLQKSLLKHKEVLVELSPRYESALPLVEDLASEAAKLVQD